MQKERKKKGKILPRVLEKVTGKQTILCLPSIMYNAYT